jgi:putative endonuclease
MTANIEKRLWQHNQGFSRYTKNKGPWQLVYCKPFPTKKEALMAEKKLKKAGSDYLQKCIRDYQSKP